MSLDEFQTIERFDGKTIAESKAELTASEKYFMWLEKDDGLGDDEIHFQHRHKEYIPPDDQALIKAVYGQAHGDAIFFGNDGHGFVSIRHWENPDGEIVGAEGLFDRLLEVM